MKNTEIDLPYESQVLQLLMSFMTSQLLVIGYRASSLYSISQMSRCMTKPSKGAVHPEKIQISLGIHPV